MAYKASDLCRLSQCQALFVFTVSHGIAATMGFKSLIANIRIRLHTIVVHSRVIDISAGFIEITMRLHEC